VITAIAEALHVGLACYPGRGRAQLETDVMRAWELRRMAARLAETTGHPARSDYKRPEEPDVLPPPDAFAVAPCTFNTVGKWAAGISDTLALGLLNEALGAGRPIIAVPNPHVDLAQHPAFGRNVEFLRGCGVQVLFDPERYPLPNGSNDPRLSFPWKALKAKVTTMLARVQAR
jgi:hypothetical protein